MAGRKPILTLVKKAKGTLRKCRVNNREPKPPLALPIAPEFLPARAQYWFGMVSAWLQAMKIVSPVDTANQSMLALRLEEIERLTKQIEAEGSTYYSIRFQEGPDGKVMMDAEGKPLHVKLRKGHPAVAQRNEAMRHAQSLCAEFGLSPANRAKVNALGEKPADDGWSDLANG
jgi:P27 family predicted phage terminase small subunit